MAVTITRGKTHTRFARLLLDGVDVSGDARQLQSVGIGHNESEISGWDDTLEVFMHGRGILNFGPFRSIFNNTAAATGVGAGSYQTLNGINVSIATYVQGIMEAPTIGAPAFSANVKQFNAMVEVGSNNPVILEGAFSGPVGVEADWGVALAVGTSRSASVDLGSVDNSASSANGYLAFGHVVQSEGAMGTNNWSIVIEHSTDDVAFSTLDSFTLDGSAVGAERLSGSGTVNRYVRVALTKTAGTDIIPWINFIRL